MGSLKEIEKLYQSLYEESKRLIQLVEQMEQLKEWDHVSTQNFSEKSPVHMEKIVEQSVEMFRWALTDRQILKLHVDVHSKYRYLIGVPSHK